MTRRLLWLMAGVVLTLASCGSSGDEAGSTTTAGPEASPERSMVTTVPPSLDDTLTSPEAGASFGVDEVIRFDPGGTSATISDAVVRGERNRYTLEAAAGQTMNVEIDSLENNAVFDVLGADGALLAREATTASIVLPSDGVYSLILGGARGNASYELTVEIPAS